MSGEGAASLRELESYEDIIAEGQRMKLDLNLVVAPPTDAIATLEDKLQNAGVPATVEATGSTVRVIARKGFPWLAIIVAVILGLVILAILIVSWQFYREVAVTVPKPVMVAGIVVGIVLLAVLTFILASRQLPVGGEA